jgi:hypothetical protein
MEKMFLVSLVFVLVSCNLRDVNYSDEEILKMKHDIIDKNNIDSYSKLFTFIGNNDSLLYVEMLPYSLKMMEVKKSDSQFDFFQYFLRLRFNGKYNPDDLNKLVKPEQDLLIYYLEQGSKESSNYCTGIISGYYRKGIYYKKDIKKADSIYMATYGHPYPNKTE